MKIDRELLCFTHKPLYLVIWKTFSPYKPWLVNSLARPPSMTSHVASRRGLTVTIFVTEGKPFKTVHQSIICFLALVIVYPCPKKAMCNYNDMNYVIFQINLFCVITTMMTYFCKSADSLLNINLSICKLNHTPDKSHICEQSSNTPHHINRAKLFM